MRPIEEANGSAGIIPGQRARTSAAALLAVPALIGVLFCTGETHPVAAGDGARHGVDRSYMDTTCAPCRAFYEYANGAWIARARRTSDEAASGVLDELQRRSADVVHATLDSLGTSHPAPRSLGWKLGEFYGTCMDTARAEREGPSPVRAELDRIDRVTSRSALEAEVARLNRMQLGVVFGFGVTADPRHADSTIGHLMAGGLGLPDAGYYTLEDSTTRHVRDAYRRMLDSLLVLAGTPPDRAARDATRALALETSLAGLVAAGGPGLGRDPRAHYHKLTVRALDSLTPHWSWTQYFLDLGAPAAFPATASLLVEQPELVRSLDGLLATVPLDSWRSYLRGQYIQSAAPWLNGAFRRTYSGTAALMGMTPSAVRWRRCVSETDQLLGNALGQEYVRRAFTSGAKGRLVEMVHEIEGVLHDDLDTLPWMSAATRRAAVAKLRHFTVKIGYPARWPDYSALVVRDTSFWTNVVAASEFQTDADLAKLGRAVDRSDLQYTPQTVDAYFNPRRNEVGFAAGVLQPPLFDSLADDASNYGAIGVVIGHELTHAFDEQGRQYDSTAELHDWWVPADDSAFRRRAALLVRQYDEYLVVDSLHINGSRTLSENLADLGGVVLAYRALERKLAGRPRPAVGGFTPEQRFFIAYAQSRRGLFSPAYLRNKVLTNDHSPDEWRVLAPIADMPEFATAFHCRAGDPMIRPDSLRVRMW